MDPNAPVAQLDRALPSEGKGHTFESCRVRQYIFRTLPRRAEARIGPRQPRLRARRTTMYGSLSLAELDDRIAIVRDNLRQLVEQAAATSGSQNEERIADRIAQQEEELSKLVRER